MTVFNTAITTTNAPLMPDSNLLEHNARAWDKQAQTESPWSLPVSSEQLNRPVVGNGKCICCPRLFLRIGWVIFKVNPFYAWPVPVGSKPLFWPQPGLR